MTGLAHRGSKLKDPSRHLASFLAAHGYHTALAGVQHEATHRPGLAPKVVREQKCLLGYQDLLDERPPAANGEEAAARRAADFIERSDSLGKPFFLACGFFTTHRNGNGPVQWHNGDQPAGDARYAMAPQGLPDTPETRQDFADFAQSANRLDQYMGIVFDAIDRAGRHDDTLVICTTDHGIAFPGAKGCLNDRGIGVMLMVRGPGGFSGGKVIDQLVSQIDLFPTICELTGLTPPDWLRGRSVTPLLTDPAQPLHEAVYANLNFHAAKEVARAVRTDRWKYVRRWNVQNHPIVSNCDDSISKDVLIQAGWNNIPQSEEALFDLYFDPNEAHNLILDPSKASVVTEMRARLQQWMQETGDPLLTGRISPEPGMVLNPVDGRSPRSKEGQMIS
jgi:arylsulfatase A-like enzyme